MRRLCRNQCRRRGAGKDRTTPPLTCQFVMTTSRLAQRSSATGPYWRSDRLDSGKKSSNTVGNANRHDVLAQTRTVSIHSYPEPLTW